MKDIYKLSLYATVQKFSATHVITATVVSRPV